MLKILNSRNPSLFEILTIWNFPGARRLFKLFYPSEYDNFIAIGDLIFPPAVEALAKAPFSKKALVHGANFLKGFQPLADLFKGFIDTFRPYKSTHHFLSDLAQPLRGIGNILKGLLTLAGMSLLIPANILALLIGTLVTRDLKYLVEIAENLLGSLTTIIDSVLTVGRGLIQILTTPLTWFLKIPLRGIIAGFLGKPKIQNNRGIKRLLDEADKPDDDETWDRIKEACITLKLEQKYKKAQRQGRLIPEIGEEFKKPIIGEYLIYLEEYDEETIYRKQVCDTDYISFFKSITSRTENADVTDVIEIDLESPSTNNAPKASTGLRHFLFKPQYPKTRATAGFIIAAGGSGLAYTALTPKLAMMLLGTALTPHVAIALLAVGLFLAAVGTAMFIHGLIANCRQSKKSSSHADRDIEAQQALDSLGIN